MGTSFRWRSGRGAGLSLILLAVFGAGLATAPAASAAPAWLAPVDLSAPLRDALDPEVAMDEAGRTVAVWEREGITPFQRAVQASTRGLGEPFSAPVDLSVPAQDPKLAMTSGGEAVAAWWHSESGNYVLQASRRPPEGSFSSPVEVTELPQKGSPPEIHLAVNTSGKAALAWVEENEAEKGVVMVSTIAAGGSPSDPLPVSSGAHEAAGPQVAVDDAGQITVAWDGYSEAEERPGLIQATEGPGATFSTPEDVSDADLAAEPRLALDPAGEPTVAWVGFEQKPEGEWKEPGKPEYFPGVVEASTSSGSGFDPPVDVSDDPTDAMFSPSLAIGSNGTAVVAWVRNMVASDQIVQAAARAPGGEFSAPQDLSDETNEARRPDVAVSPLGVSTVVWEGGGTPVIQASMRPPAGPFGEPLDLSAPDSDALFPRVAMDHDGDAVAVWSRSNGANKIAQAAGFDANPPQLRNLSVPAAGTVGVPVPFSVEPFDVWPLSATTFDFGDGGSAPGTSTSHAYGAPGTYHVTATATDEAGSSATAGADITVLASSDFRLGKLKLNRRKGTATLLVEVPGPGGLLLFGKGVKRISKQASAAGSVKLPVRAVGRAAKRLGKRGKAKLKLRVRFSPEDGPAAEQARKAVLKKLLRERHRR